MRFEDFPIHLRKLEQQLGQFLNDDAPELAGNIAVERFKQNFQKEGFFGTKWQEVQRRTPETKAYKSAKPADRERKVLTGRTANLGRSIDYRLEGKGTAIVHSDTAYGKYHNDGEGKMPKRQFMGYHRQLDDAIYNKLNKELDKILKQ